MARKRRFIVNFTKYKKETFLNISSDAVKGVKGNPDFDTAPVKIVDLEKAVNEMVVAAPDAVRKDIDGMRIFKPLRDKVEGMLSQLGAFAQSTIGDKPARMEASGLLLSKEPAGRDESLTSEVAKAKVVVGPVVGNITVSSKSNKAADGLHIWKVEADGKLTDLNKVKGFKHILSGYKSGEVVLLQLCYWNNLGDGPLLAMPLVVIVK